MRSPTETKETLRIAFIQALTICFYNLYETAPDSFSLTFKVTQERQSFWRSSPQSLVLTFPTASDVTTVAKKLPKDMVRIKGSQLIFTASSYARLCREIDPFNTTYPLCSLPTPQQPSEILQMIDGYPSTVSIRKAHTQTPSDSSGTETLVTNKGKWLVINIVDATTTHNVDETTPLLPNSPSPHACCSLFSCFK